MHNDNNIKYRVENETWEDIAHLAYLFHIELDNNNSSTKKLKKELCLVRHILHQNLCKPENIEHFLTTSSFVKMVQTINRFEKAFDKNNLNRRDFLFFLKAILVKMRRQRLTVQKTLERVIEFKKMKDMVENGHGKNL